jgi:hypothetical protein
MGKVLHRKTRKYPGVRFDPKLKKYIATHNKGGSVRVATCATFEQAKTAKIKMVNDG